MKRKTLGSHFFAYVFRVVTDTGRQMISLAWIEANRKKKTHHPAGAIKARGCNG
jgi:hypothetical protein